MMATNAPRRAIQGLYLQKALSELKIGRERGRIARAGILEVRKVSEMPNEGEVYIDDKEYLVYGIQGPYRENV